jgi:PadR family transcriptional regulator PadR
MTMPTLGELEQVVLLAVLRLGADAYGVPIQAEIHARARRDLTLGTIYKTLSRLEEKGIVTSRMGEPTAQRGGRAKRYYTVTAAGRRALHQTFAALRSMAAGLDVGLEPG